MDLEETEARNDCASEDQQFSNQGLEFDKRLTSSVWKTYCCEIQKS
jgi:hypothetical protein